MCNDSELLNAAIRQNDHATVKKLLEKSSFKKTMINSIFHLAIEHEAIEVVYVCLKMGLDPNEPGRKGIKEPNACLYCLNQAKLNKSITRQVTKKKEFNLCLFMFFLIPTFSIIFFFFSQII